jgi:hypothetical protein
MNIVDVVKGLISDDLMRKLGSLIGEGTERTETAVNAAVPALLAGLSNVASSGADGVRKLTSALEAPGLGDLGNITNMLTGNAESVVQKGTGLLNSLFGNATLSGLVNALAKFLGLQSSSIKNLLAALIPLVLGALMKQKRTLGLDAQGLAGMLAEQKSNIAAAMPAGLSNALAGVPGLGAVADAARAGYANVSDGVRTAAERARAATPASPLRWLVPLAVLLALGLLLWNYFGRAPTPSAPTGVTTTSARIPEVPTPRPPLGAAEVTRLTDDLKGALNSATTTLAEIKDAATAEAALPEIEKINGNPDTAYGLFDRVPAASRGTIVSLVKDQMGKLQEPTDKVKALPGLGDKARAAVDAMLAKVKAFMT